MSLDATTIDLPFDPDARSAVQIPILPETVRDEDLASTWSMTGGFAAFVVWLGMVVYGFSGDGWLISKLMGAVGYAILGLVPAGIVFVIGMSLSRMFHMGTRPAIETQFRTTMTEAFGSEPTLFHDWYPGLKEARFFALDIPGRALFTMQTLPDQKVWQVERLPLSIVRRYEMLTASNSTTRGRASGDEVTFTTQTSSQYGVRLHYMDAGQKPGMSLISFQADERKAQEWLTALGG